MHCLVKEFNMLERIMHAVFTVTVTMKHLIFFY